MSVDPRAEERLHGSRPPAPARDPDPRGLGARSESPGRASFGTRQLIADLGLLMVTAVWGGTFVMVKNAVAAYPVFSFLALRFAFAALALLPLLVFARLRPGARPGRSIPLRFGVAGATLIGLALFAGYGFQTLGLHLTTPAKAGFITGMSVVLVPVAAALLLRQSPGAGSWAGVGLATVGLALLSWQPGQEVNPGDLLVLCCTVAFAAHILLIGRFAGRVNALWLTFGQILVVGVASAAAALAFEVRPALTVPVVVAAAFTGLLCTSAAFGIQTVAQRFTTSTHTALIFAAEPVFAALFSFLLIGEALGALQLAGCVLILGGMLAAELSRR